MRNTKYVMTKSGKFVMANELTGLQHVDLVRFIGSIKQVRIESAGFVYLEEGTFRVYGRSIGLDIASNIFAADAMNRALFDKELRVLDIRDGDAFIATNFKGEPIADLSVLAESRIVPL